MPAMTAARYDAGFTALEVLVAATLLATALLAGLRLQADTVRTDRQTIQIGRLLPLMTEIVTALRFDEPLPATMATEAGVAIDRDGMLVRLRWLVAPEAAMQDIVFPVSPDTSIPENEG